MMHDRVLLAHTNQFDSIQVSTHCNYLYYITAQSKHTWFLYRLKCAPHVYAFLLLSVAHSLTDIFNMSRKRGQRWWLNVEGQKRTANVLFHASCAFWVQCIVMRIHEKAIHGQGGTPSEGSPNKVNKTRKLVSDMSIEWVDCKSSISAAPSTTLCIYAPRSHLGSPF